VATASFLRESVLAFRDIVRGRRSVICPVVANASDAVKEELDELVKSRGGILMTCQLAEDGTISNPSLIGRLDRKQQLTFDLVRQRGETDAMELMREFGGSEDVGSTAWNKRLSSLAALGLVIEMSFGADQALQTAAARAVKGGSFMAQNSFDAQQKYSSNAGTRAAGCSARRTSSLCSLTVRRTPRRSILQGKQTSMEAPRG
jgi:hypothetical protein